MVRLVERHDHGCDVGRITRWSDRSGDGVGHARCIGQHRLDRFEFEPDAAHLDLMVAPSAEPEHAVGVLGRRCRRWRTTAVRRHVHAGGSRSDRAAASTPASPSSPIRAVRRASRVRTSSPVSSTTRTSAPSHGRPIGICRRRRAARRPCERRTRSPPPGRRCSRPRPRGAVPSALAAHLADTAHRRTSRAGAGGGRADRAHHAR